MSPLNPSQVEQLQLQRKMAKRALGQGRRWYLRAILMMIIAVVAAYRGAQVNDIVAVIMVILAGISASMGRSIRRGARASLEKIDLMERSTPEQPRALQS